MTEKNQKPQDHRRVLWLIYADMNTRFNILLEECLHLQDLLAGMVGRGWSFNECFTSPKDSKSYDLYAERPCVRFEVEDDKPDCSCITSNRENVCRSD